MTRQLPVYSRSQSGLFALVSDEDFEAVNRWRWRLSNKQYVIRSFTVEGREGVVSLHREIMQPPQHLVVDHINGVRWDCRRENLRVITPSQNMMNRARFRNNSSGWKGITRLHGKYHPRIEKDHRLIHLGVYENLETAVLTYDCAARLLFGADIPWLNLPGQPIPPEVEQYVRSVLAKQGLAVVGTLE
jgi:HNH endonuclease